MSKQSLQFHDGKNGLNQKGKILRYDNIDKKLTVVGSKGTNWVRYTNMNKIIKEIKKASELANLMPSNVSFVDKTERFKKEIYNAKVLWLDKYLENEGDIDE